MALCCRLGFVWLWFCYLHMLVYWFGTSLGLWALFDRLWYWVFKALINWLFDRLGYWVFKALNGKARMLFWFFADI